MPSTSKPGESPPDRRVPPKPTRTIHLAHSPDADDAFMFWALAAGKIDTGDRRYEHELADIETLNRRALSGELEVTAVSLHAYAHLADPTHCSLTGQASVTATGPAWWRAPGPPRMSAPPSPPPAPSWQYRAS